MAGRKVFVGSLPDNITEVQLREELGKYGQVEDVFVKPNCEPGRQWAFVTFATVEQALLTKDTCDRVLTFPGSDRPCDVMLAKNQGMGGAGGVGVGVVQPIRSLVDGGFQQAMAGGLVGFGGMAYDAQGNVVQQVLPAEYMLPQLTPLSLAPKKIFVGSLPDGVSDGILRQEFSKYGAVEDIFIKPNCEQGRQWAFVSFTSPEQAQHAVEMTNQILLFPGSLRSCEVTLARNQGLFGQDPISGVPNKPGMMMDGQMAMGMGFDSQLLPGAGSIAPKKIFVGSLPDHITDEMMRMEFSKYGQITDMFIRTGCERGRQWAFVTFASPEEAELARCSCDRVLKFPGAEVPCEVTLARHQGKFGQEPITGDATVGHGGQNQQMAVMQQQGAVSYLANSAYMAPGALDAEGPRKIFVGSLPNSITETVLRQEFSKYGQITDLFLKQGCESGRQWAFITFWTPEQAQYAKDCTDRVLVFPGADRTCEVMLAKNQGKFGQAPIEQFNGAAVGGMEFVMEDGGAQPPPPVTPPPAHLTPWRMYKTASGLPYYHNAAAGITQWECPPELQPAQQPARGPIAYTTMGAVAGQRYAPY